MTDFATFRDATALASDLHAKLEAIRTEAARVGGHAVDDMADIVTAECAVDRALRRLLRLTQMAANREAAEAPAFKIAAE